MEKGVTVWFTGLPSSGKTTVSVRLVELLKERGLKKIEVLDGDVIRTNLSKGLTFSKEDRDTNIMRIAFVCHLLSRNGAIAIAAAISPYKAIRDDARRMIGDFVEVYVNCPVEVCAERDPKGNYKKAFAGEIKNFTGVDDPYEEPLDPEVVVKTNEESLDDCANKIIVKLEEMGYIPGQGDSPYSQEEAKVIEERLSDLGYL
jgi:adenylylsulfate kinase